nr:MAG TPA: hypothetical protein [Caudoviricetes sp.]
MNPLSLIFIRNIKTLYHSLYLEYITVKNSL